MFHIDFDVQQEPTAAQPLLPLIPRPGLQGASKLQAGGILSYKARPYHADGTSATFSRC